MVHTSSFSTCVSVGDLEKGNKLHACVLRNGFESVFVMSLVILTYMKCKNIDDVFQMFDKMIKVDLGLFNLHSY